MSNLYSQLGYHARAFHALQLVFNWFSVFGAAYWPLASKQSFKRHLVCKFDIKENTFSIAFSSRYAFLFAYILIPHVIACFGCLIFTPQIVLNFCWLYSAFPRFHRRSLDAFYWLRSCSFIDRKRTCVFTRTNQRVIKFLLLVQIVNKGFLTHPFNCFQKEGHVYVREFLKSDGHSDDSSNKYVM